MTLHQTKMRVLFSFCISWIDAKNERDRIQTLNQDPFRPTVTVSRQMSDLFPLRTNKKTQLNASKNLVEQKMTCQSFYPKMYVEDDHMYMI